MNGAYLALLIDKNGGGIAGEVVQLGQRTGHIFLADCSAKEDGVAGMIAFFKLANGFLCIGFVVFPSKAIPRISTPRLCFPHTRVPEGIRRAGGTQFRESIPITTFPFIVRR